MGAFLFFVILNIRSQHVSIVRIPPPDVQYRFRGAERLEIDRSVRDSFPVTSPQRILRGLDR